uniref:DDE Tnp4 domain-containing protein n=1 Tax=Mycena chlorophos TaxID=658473 RepID=A0ABQ0L0T4_MYCCL|nr:predicted protein [Mycena chlorophos]
MLNAFSEGEFYNKFVQLPTADDPPPAYLLKNEGKLWPFFRNCLGALDGSHIACTATAADRSNTRNRKGFLSQNVLAVCSFSLRFIYILSGWEGSVSDASLWADARINDFPIPAGYYYLGDAGFPLTAKLITPFRSTRYHLQEWALGRRRCVFEYSDSGIQFLMARPQTREELFNLRHAQARNVIERIFGVIKKRWRVLVIPPSYRMSIQARIPPALAALHNFILQHDPEDRVDPTIRDDPSPGYHPRMDNIGDIATERHNAEESEEGVALRDRVADEMWEQYQDYLTTRGPDVEQMELDQDENEDMVDEEGYQSAMEDETEGL